MVKKSKQKDLFGLDPKEEEKLLSYESLKEKMYRKAEEKIKLKEEKTKKKARLKEKKRLEEEKGRFLKSEKKAHEKTIEQLKIYLSWGRSLKYAEPDYGQKYYENIHKTISQEVINKSDSCIFRLKWILPLYEELFGTIDEKDFIFSGEDSFCWPVSEYGGMLESCVDLFNPKKDFYDYFILNTSIKMKPEKQKPFWLEDHVIGDPIHSEGGSKFFKDQKISFQREKNIITLEWELPEDFESIEFHDDGELEQRIHHSLM